MSNTELPDEFPEVSEEELLATIDQVFEAGAENEDIEQPVT